MKRFSTAVEFFFIILLLSFLVGCEREEYSPYTLTEHLFSITPPCCINIVFSVTDEDNQPVTDLTIDDFLLRENSKTITPKETPVLLKDKSNISSAMQTVLLLDLSNRSSGDIEYLKKALTVFCKRRLSNQEIAIYTISEEPDLVQDFTGDVVDLINSINSLQPATSAGNLIGNVVHCTALWQDIFSEERIDQGNLILVTHSGWMGSANISSAADQIAGKRIFVIGIGEQVNEEELKEIETSGYYWAAGYEQLASVLNNEVLESLLALDNNFYWLYYLSSRRGDNLNNVKLILKDNPGYGPGSYISRNFNSTGFTFAKKGITINGGLDYLTINPNDQYILEAKVNFPELPPVLEWETTINSALSAERDPADNARIIIKASGNPGQTSVITVSDRANSFRESIRITINKTNRGQFKDERDNRLYRTVTIGTQTWMAENLNYDPTRGNWSYDNSPILGTVYGQLYDFETACNVCPDGWHLASDGEWLQLVEHFGGSRVAAVQLKESSSLFWNTPNLVAAEPSGFDALPGGARLFDGFFEYEGYTANFWSSTRSTDLSSYAITIYGDRREVSQYDQYNDSGYSVRCVKD